MKYLHKAFGLLFSLYYINRVVAILGFYLGFDLFFFPNIILVGLLIAYILMLVVDSYNHNEKRLFPILFLVMIGVILVFPEFTMINIFFLIIYSYMNSRRSLYTVPLSFITIGYFAMGFIPIVGYLLVTYGWGRYFIKKTIREI